MRDYYDPWPSLVLDRHLALAAALSADARHVGSFVSAEYGLPYLDVERQVEHAAGRSLRQLAREEGLAGLRVYERRVVLALLRQRPRGVLVLGESTLIDPELAPLVREQTTLVGLVRGLEECHRRLVQIAATGANNVWPLALPSSVETPEDLAPYHRERTPALENAPHAFSLAGASPSSLVSKLRAVMREAPGWNVPQA